MNAALIRGRLLLEQGRYELAEEELRRALAENPEDATAHTFLALCLVELKKFDAALDSARHAVGLEPDYALCHYALAIVLFRSEEEAAKNSLFSNRAKFAEAEAALQEAIRLNPDEAHFFATLASIRLVRCEWASALDAAEQGLRIDPENVECANCRATALVKLGRRSEAGDVFEAVLSKDPENTHTHANKGWALLHANDHTAALEHFKESLRIDPANEYAQAGIVEALKARNFIYRWMLAYFLWMSRLPDAARWGVILGGYVGMRLLGKLAKSNPGLAPFVLPLMALYAIFVAMSWTAPHLFNLLLRLDKYGKYALSSSQIMGANCVGLCVLFAVGMGVAGMVSDSGLLLLGAFGSLGLMIPVGGTFNREGKARLVLGTYTAVLAGIGIAALTMAFLNSGLGPTLGNIFLVGIILFSWGANIITSRF